MGMKYCSDCGKLQKEIIQLKAELAEAKARQLGENQVAVDIPEPDEDGACSVQCPFAVYANNKVVKWHCSLKLEGGYVNFCSYPGPGCPRFEK